MSLDRPIQDAKEGVEGQVRNLLWWLPDPYECPECGVYCEADTGFSVDTAAFDQGRTEIWVCPECQREFYRE